MFDRRQLMTRVAGALIAGLAAPRVGAGQAYTALTDRLALIAAGGTNVLVLSTADGVVLVDSGAPDRSDALMAMLRALSLSPSAGALRTVFNTHYHPENTGTNELLRQAGATIVAHENTR